MERKVCRDIGRVAIRSPDCQIQDKHDGMQDMLRCH